MEEVFIQILDRLELIRLNKNGFTIDDMSPRDKKYRCPIYFFLIQNQFRYKYYI